MQSILVLITAVGSISNAILIIPAILALTIITWMSSSSGMSTHVEANNAKPVPANTFNKGKDDSGRDSRALGHDPERRDNSLLSNISDFFGL